MSIVAPALTDSRRLSLVHIASKFPNTGHQNVRLTDSIQMLLHYMAMDVTPGGSGEVSWGQMVQYVGDSVAQEAALRAAADIAEGNARTNADNQLSGRITNLTTTVADLSGALLAHTSNSDIHVTLAEKNLWNGIVSAYVFDTEAAMNSWISIPANKSKLRVGDLLLIRALNVPDYWWDGYTPQILETKIDLVGYLALTGGTMTGSILYKDSNQATTEYNAYGIFLNNGKSFYSKDAMRVFNTDNKTGVEAASLGQVLVYKGVTSTSGTNINAGARLTYYGLLFTDQTDGADFFKLENGAVSGNEATRASFAAWLGTSGGGGAYLPLAGGTMTGAINFTDTSVSGYRSAHGSASLSFSYSNPDKRYGNSSITAEYINCGSGTAPGTSARLFNVAGADSRVGASCGLRLTNSNAEAHSFEIDVGKGTVTGSDTMRVAMNGWLGSGSASSPLTTKGDLLGFTTAPARIPAGTTGQVLTTDPTVAAGVKWTAASSLLSELLTTKGDLLGSSGTSAIRIPVGTNGQVLTADSSVPGGVKWAASTVSGLYLPLSGGDMSGDIRFNTGDGIVSTKAYSAASAFVRSNGFIIAPGGVGIQNGGISGYSSLSGFANFFSDGMKTGFMIETRIPGGAQREYLMIASSQIDGSAPTVNMSVNMRAAFRAALGIT